MLYIRNFVYKHLFVFHKYGSLLTFITYFHFLVYTFTFVSCLLCLLHFNTMVLEKHLFIIMFGFLMIHSKLKFKLCQIKLNCKSHIAMKLGTFDKLGTFTITCFQSIMPIYYMRPYSCPNSRSKCICIDRSCVCWMYSIPII